jgi:hypothetical protein
MTSGLCQYKDILGKPGQGFHEARIIGTDFALWDTVGTLILMLCFILLGYNPILVILSISAIAIGLHWLFCVDTTFDTTSNKLLGINF